MTEHRIETPLTEEIVSRLRSGDRVLISGFLYTARDAAHKKFMDLIEKGKPLPIDLTGQIIYYAGPAPARPGRPIGSIGPTSSYRMDAYAPALHRLGLKATIGKGSRSQAVKDALTTHQAVYLAAVGGAAALLSKCIESSEIVAYPELGPEAVIRLKVRDFPCIVINDCYGGDLYEEGRRRFRSA